MEWELQFDIETKHISIKKASIGLIFALRRDTSLVINTERGQFSYKRFRKLTLIRKCILQLENREGSEKGSATESEEEAFVDAVGEEKKQQN